MGKVIKQYDDKLGKRYSLYDEDTGEIIRGDKFLKHKSGDGSYIKWNLPDFIKCNCDVTPEKIIGCIGYNYFGYLMCLMYYLDWDNSVNPKILLTNHHLKQRRYYDFMQKMYEYNIIYKHKAEYETTYYINPMIAIKGNVVKIELYNMFKDGYRWSNRSNFKTKE